MTTEIAAEGNRLSILFLGTSIDSDSNAHNIKALLETTTHFEYELQAYSELERLSEINTANLDVILLDLDTSGETSVEILQRVNAALSNVPIIVISDDDDQDDRVLSMKNLGVHDYLVRTTLSESQLRRCIRRTMQQCQRERELFNSEQRLRSTINTMGLGIVHMGFDGTIVEVNPAFEQITGYTAKELQRLNLYHMIYTLDTDFDQLKWEAVRTGALKQHRVEKRFIHKEGHVIWLEMHIAFQQAMAEWDDHYLVVLQDVTRRKYVEQALEVSNERFRITLKNSPTTVFNQDRALRITWIHNARYERTADELVGKTDLELIDNREDALYLVKLKQSVLDTGKGLRKEVRIRNMGRTSYYDLTVEPLFDLDHEVIGITCAAIDITDRIRVEEEERQQRVLAEAIRDSAIALNGTLDLSSVLEEILDNLHRVVEHDTADVVLYHGDTFQIMQSRGYPLDLFKRQYQSLEIPVQSFPLLLHALEINAPVVIDDVTKTKEWVMVDSYTQLRSYMIMPIRQQRKIIGFINLGSNEVGYFATAHIERLQTFAEHAAIAIQNARLFAQSQELATAQERQRLARELHDSVSQTLFTASIIAESLPQLVDKNPAKVKEMLQELYFLNRGALAETRILIDEFRPDRSNVSLVDQLRNLASALRARKRLEVEFKHNVSTTPSLPAKIALFRIAQEVFANIIRHSDAEKVSIALKDVEDNTLLEIKDDGVGFDLAEVQAGKGLRVIEEYASSVDAKLQIESAPKKGTVIRVELPTFA